MKKILWPVGGVGETQYVLRILRSIEKKTGAQFTLVTDLDPTVQLLTELGVPFKTVGQLFDEAAADIPTNTEELFAKANAILKDIDLSMLVHADHMLKLTMQHHTACILAAKTVIAYDTFFRKEGFNAVIRYGGNNLNFWVPSIMGEKYHAPSFVLVYVGEFIGCAVQPAGIKEQWDCYSFNRLWPKWQDKIVPDEEKKKIDEGIDAYVQKRCHGGSSQAVRLYEFNKKMRLSRRIKNWISSKLRPEPRPLKVEDEQAYLRSPNVQYLESLFNNYIRLGQEKWMREYPHFTYDAVPEKYVYMPLNQPFDCPHRAWNPMNYLQEFAATVVHESLPVGYHFVIKEHPYSAGYPSLEDLGRLQRLGVKIIHPNHSSLDLIKNASAIFCPGDTTGWEGLLLQRPVINYGAFPFYSKHPRTINVSDPNQVHHALRHALTMSPMTPTELEKHYAFIDCVYKSTYPGNIWGYKGLIWASIDQSDDNVEQIAHMVRTEMDFVLGH